MGDYAMTNIQHLAEAYVEARRLHKGQSAAWVRFRDAVNAAMASRFPKLPDVVMEAPAAPATQERQTFAQRLRSALRTICGEVA